MLRRGIQIVIIGLGIASLAWLASWHTQAITIASQALPFTAVRLDSTFVAGGSIPTRSETKTIAVRSDGSSVELWQRDYPDQPGRTIFLRKIKDVARGQHVIVDPISESITTYSMAEQGKAFHAMKASSQCEGSPAGELLGYPVTLAETVVDGEELAPNFDELLIQVWLSAKLNCYPLRRESKFSKAGVEIQRIVETVVTVKEGEPEGWIFDLPATYIERPPSAAMAEAARRFPGVKGIACQTCVQSKKDEAYYHAQKHNLQK